jgi:hypothetical protein
MNDDQLADVVKSNSRQVNALERLGELSKIRDPVRRDAFAAMRALIYGWGIETARDVWALAGPRGGRWKLKLIERPASERIDDPSRRRKQERAALTTVEQEILALKIARRSQGLSIERAIAELSEEMAEEGDEPGRKEATLWKAWNAWNRRRRLPGYVSIYEMMGLPFEPPAPRSKGRRKIQ